MMATAAKRKAWTNEWWSRLGADKSRYVWKYNLRRYKLTPEEYEGLWESQDGLCAVCSQPERTVHWKTGQLRRLAVDHNHRTGKRRGLLCNRCNRAIGMLEDSPDLLGRIVSYLTKNTG